MNHAKKHIVLLTTWYPPLQSIAAYRMEAFAKYLDYEKFRLTIVTLGSENNFGLSEDGDLNVYRIKPQKKLWNPSFKSTDSRFRHYVKVAWKRFQMKLKGDENDFYCNLAVKFVEDLHAANPVDLIISSFSPAAPHVAAKILCEKYHLKWIVDMRDEMSLNPQSDSTVRKYYAGVEKDINRLAHALTSVSAPIVTYFKSVIPDLKYYVEIRNGFDHNLVLPPYHFNETFTLLHAGSFYGIRKPDTLLKALSNLQDKKLLPEKWKLICAGAVKNFSIPERLNEHVEILERIGHDESIALMAASDANVLIQPPTGRKGIFTGKIFEYIAVQKPVLAVVDSDDVAADLVREFEAGMVAEFSDVEAIEKALLEIIQNWKNKVVLKTNPDRIAQLHRKYQVQKLNLLIENLLHEK